MAAVYSLKQLDSWAIQNAFQKAQKDVKVHGFRLVHVTKDYFDKAVQFIRDHFISEEIVHRCSGLEWTEEVRDNCLEAFELHLSLMFVSEDIEDVAAIIRTAIQNNGRMNLDKVITKSLREALRFNNLCDDNADFFGHFDAKEAFHIEALAVAEKYRKRGLATKLFEATVTMIRNFGIDPVFIKVEGSSKYSKKIFEDAGFQTLGEVLFDSWEFHVHVVRTDEYTSQKNYGLKIKRNM